MNYTRVNLLKKSEQRHQGAVSRRFLLVSIVVTPILLIAIISGVKLIQYTGVQSNLRSSREIWSDLKPRLSLYQDEQKGLNANLKALQLIDGWKNTHVLQSRLLAEIQGVVPHNIQLQRLSIQSKQRASVYLKPEDCALDYSLLVQGLSLGDRAEDAVINLRRDLMTTERMRATFESVKLASMRKQVVGAGGKNVRDFKLEGSALERGGE
jgi:hypothetical protein